MIMLFSAEAVPKRNFTKFYRKISRLQNMLASQVKVPKNSTPETGLM
jgi:hypothetical protein